MPPAHQLALFAPAAYADPRPAVARSDRARATLHALVPPPPPRVVEVGAAAPPTAATPADALVAPLAAAA